ncbi:MAG TPA: PilZ domain-containing protein [Candidatus Angelobacter sp.]|nr:PilZ domain-containing protein [Candidatus Angelobacter sp.]
MRRTGRISKELPILLIGDDLGGTVFSERTSTVVLSLHGAGVLSKHKLSPEQELILRWPERNKETEIRVVGQIGSHKGVHTYGVAFVDPNLNFWEIDFPPVSDIERDLGLLSLTCSTCKTVEKIDDSSMEADICATNEGVMRFCKRCGSSTLWKSAPIALPQESVSPTNGQMALFPTAPATPSSPEPASPAAPAPEPRATTVEPRVPAPSYVPHAPAPPSPPTSAPPRATSYYSAVPDYLEEPRAAVLTMAPSEKSAPAQGSTAPPVNRRKHPRVKVNYSACVRHPQRGDDVVVCEDMSRGGLRFKSHKQYYARTLIEVAVPYQPGQPAIFVPAQIVYVEELPEQQLFRCGVQYLKPTKIRDSF